LQQGVDNNNFFIVSKGNVEIILQRPNSSDVIVAVLGPGKYFGEMEFFHERRNRASIRASESGPVEVVALDYDELNALLGESPATLEALHEAANQHEQENVEKRGGEQ
jgi:putative ABC transport system ATP-binding protein